MTERHHHFHGIERHVVIPHDIENFHLNDPVYLDPIFDNFCFIYFYFSLAVANLEDFPLCLLDLNPIRHAAFGKIPHQKTFQNFIFAFWDALTKRSIDIHKYFMVFFPVKTDIQLQYDICYKDAFLSVGIRFHLHALIDDRSFQIWNHVKSTSAAFHFSGKWYRMLQPLQGTVLIIPFIQSKQKKFSFGFYYIFFRS